MWTYREKKRSRQSDDRLACFSPRVILRRREWSFSFYVHGPASWPPAPAVGDMGDEHVAALNHPFVSAQNSVSPGHRFQRRINRFVIAFRRHGAVEIGKHQNQADVGMPTLQPMQHVCAQAIERPIAAQVKLGRPALDQPFADIGQPPAHLRAVRDLAVTAKGNNQSDHPPRRL